MRRLFEPEAFHTGNYIFTIRFQQLPTHLNQLHIHYQYNQLFYKQKSLREKFI